MSDKFHHWSLYPSMGTGVPLLWQCEVIELAYFPLSVSSARLILIPITYIQEEILCPWNFEQWFLATLNHFDFQ